MKKEQKKLPKQYNVGGQQMTILEVDRLEDNKLGTCCVAEGAVKIAKKFNDIIQSYASKQNTMWHEVVHSILDTMGEFDLSRDEKFVCTFSSFLTEVITTMK